MNEEFVRSHQDKKEDSDESDPASYESIKIKPNLEKDSTPFSTKRVCRESDTPHNKNDYGKCLKKIFFFSPEVYFFSFVVLFQMNQKLYLSQETARK
jgi:hypothetical protein